MRGPIRLAQRGQRKVRAVREWEFPFTLDQHYDPIQDAKKVYGLGERALWCAVILEALNCCQGHLPAGGATSAYKMLEAARAREWFLSSRNDMNSFNGICLNLGLDAGRIRTRLLELGVLDNPKREEVIENGETDGSGNDRGGAGEGYPEVWPF